MIKIGHRGLAGIAPENTKISFIKAIEYGLDMVELDIQLTKDRELVVFHDYNLQRIAAIDRRVEDMTLKELKEIDIGECFDMKFSGQRILDLEEVIRLLRGNLKINIEIKINRKEARFIADKLIAILDREDFQDQVIISSFDHKMIKYIKSIIPTIKAAILVSSLTIKPIELINSAAADGIHPHHLVITEDFVREIKKKGFFINTWTVNDKQEFKRLSELGVDGIMSDYPYFF
ncbi:glycerophosphodiester phosphodiesterase [Orenia marismortui]|uniref:glycerophosphodiester phosphodiesterase n=1 Tax=Orenia marismortui TaxID=46469 RepID=UPI0003722BB1|nr:glycerophosphodiester phosphodiesterase family protein [Orenia marismortui]